MSKLQKITPCLWFDGKAQEAVNLYTSLFKNSKILLTSHYTEEGMETHKKKPGEILTIKFELDGQQLTALNGGPEFKFTEAVSLQINCENQEEIDHFWHSLIADGGEESVCGWLKDKYGLSWQITPSVLEKMITDKDVEKVKRVFKALMKMKKINIAELEAAYGG
jgi:predicted 3-demethylubiquinone-9 3-methyltransferase (glyoxalase superfamily)